VRPFSFVGSGRVGAGLSGRGSGRVGAVGRVGLGLMVAGMGTGAGNRSLGAGNGSLDGFFARPVQDRQNGQDRAHVPEKCLVFDCCPDATPGGKVTAVR
jgi:hypothetical protein